jgi:hypothetical protein
MLTALTAVKLDTELEVEIISTTAVMEELNLC